MGNIMQAAYKERQVCIDAHLAERWPAEVVEGLSQADKAVPRDLIVSPPVSGLWGVFS